MPPQLYGDMQLTVKNIIFSIAKQQELDGNQSFYTFWTGDDCLESCFGLVRMQGGHNPNFTFKQLIERLAATLDLNSIFARHPRWHTGFRRLKVTRAQHLDHLNPESWIGTLLAKSIDLYTTWTRGRDESKVLLARIGETVDFDDLFDAGRDMLRPGPMGMYSGVSSDPDRSEEPSALADAPSCPPASTVSLFLAEPRPTAVANNRDVNPAEGAGSLLSSLHASESPELDDGMSPVIVELTDEELAFFQFLPVTGTSGGMGSGDGEDALDEGAELEDLIDEDDNHQLPLSPGLRPDDFSPWITVNDKRIHKASICRLVMTPDYIRKSHKRPLCVCGFTPDFKICTLDSDNASDEDVFLVGDLFATLLICGDTVCLTILKGIALEEKKLRVE